MSWRVVVIRESAKLDLKLGQMVVRQEKTIRINLNEIAVLLIESTAVSLTAALLSELTERKIKVIFCDAKRSPQSELIPCVGCHDSTSKIRTQIGWTAALQEEVWTEILREKIRNQMLFLRELKKPQADLLEGYLRQLRPGDPDNREGHAAKVYFSGLFGPEFARGQDTPTNAALNYGYGILLSAINREVCLAGYLTQLGLFHDNMFNPYNLSCDLMEPFRPLVDRAVVQLAPTQLEKEEKTRLIDLLNDEVTIVGKKQHLMHALRIYCKSVFDVLNREEGAKLRFYEL